MPSKTYKDKVAVITGGASGIGFALAQLAQKRGARLVLADWEEDALKKADALLGGGDVLTVTCDVSKPEQVEHLAQRTWETYGAVDLLFNNAGVSGGGAVADTTLQDWHWILNVNLFGAINVLHYFLPAMLERNQPAHIVNTASIAGMVSAPDMCPYNVSKHGVVTLSESLSSELRNADSPVKVSVLCPSFVKTNIHLAERNRSPEEAGLSAKEIQERIKQADEVFADFFKDAMTAENMADKVFEAIEAERFYIFSHPKGSRAAVKKRMQTILEDGTPYIPNPSAFPTEIE